MCRLYHTIYKHNFERLVEFNFCCNFRGLIMAVNLFLKQESSHLKHREYIWHKCHCFLIKTKWTENSLEKSSKQIQNKLQNKLPFWRKSFLSDFSTRLSLSLIYYISIVKFLYKIIHVNSVMGLIWRRFDGIVFNEMVLKSSWLINHIILENNFQINA